MGIRKRQISILIISILIYFSFTGCETLRRISKGGLKVPERLTPSKETVELKAKGEHINVIEGTLFIPDYFEKDNYITLFIHFLGPGWLTEENFYQTDFNAVHYTSNLSGLSSVFSNPFKDQNHLREIITDIESKLREKFNLPELKVMRLCFTSFSAGYGAVREILKSEEYFDLTEMILMADSIYSSYLAPKLRVPPIEQMKDFVRFAQASALKKKTMIVTHSNITPQYYCSTVETADLLLSAIGGKRQKVNEYTERGVPIASKCDVGNFHLLAFEENDKEKEKQLHMDNLYMIGELLRKYYAPKNIISNSIYWHKRIKVFEVENDSVKSGGFVFLGDSITEGFKLSNFFPDKNVINRGISGDKIGGWKNYGVLDRLYVSVYDPQPAKLFILIGINDIIFAKTPEEFQKKGYEEILSDLKDNFEGKVFVQSLLPVSGESYGKYLPEVVEFNSWLKSLAEKFNYTYIDLYPNFCDENGFLKAELTNDGLHLTDKGYEVWKNVLLPYLQ